jgi:hypothetical protein
LLVKSHKNICSLGGTDIFHMTGVYIYLIPLSLVTTCIVCRYLSEEANCHIMTSSSSLNEMPLVVTSS